MPNVNFAPSLKKNIQEFENQLKTESLYLVYTGR